MKRNRFLILLLAILLAFFCFTPGLHVFAATATSNVLDDLKKDENFNPDNYSSMTLDTFNLVNTDKIETNDVSCVNVIQIAETDEKKLYIYTYEPLKGNIKLFFNKVSIFTDFVKNPKDINPILFDLKLLSSDGVFSKYEVVDYTVSSELYRYYNIVSIYRSKNINLDGSSTSLEIAEGIGQQWCCYYYNDELIYEMESFKTVEIKPNLSGSIRFQNGFSLKKIVYDISLDAHILAFDIVGYDPDKIYDATVVYDYNIYQRKTFDLFGKEFIELEEETLVKSYNDKTKKISDEDILTFSGKGLWAKEYSCERIMTGFKYISFLEDNDCDVSSEYLEKIKASQWVFSFTEVPVISVMEDYLFNSVTYQIYRHSYGKLSNVGLLQIHFMQGGKTYNLGVVGNRIESSGNLGTIDGIDYEKMNDSFNDIFMIIGLILLLVVLVAAAPLLKYIIDGLVFIIKIPFKIIDFIFPKKKK